ncbi:MAG: helix-turn-helix transcriptional regulator [Planctomycetota bacterium]
MAVLEEFDVSFACDDGIPSLPRPVRLLLRRVDNPQFQLDLTGGAGRATAVFGYSLRGAGRLEDGGRERPLPAGTAWLCSLHRGGTRLAVSGPGLPWDIILFAFAGAGELVEDVRRRIGVTFPIPRESGVLMQLQRFASMDGETITPNRAESARQVLAVLCAGIDQHQGANSGLSHLVRQACGLLHRHVEASYDIGRLAAELSVSQEHLTRVFKKEVGRPPGAYQAALRLQRACELLKASNHPITTIAERLGYDSASHFSRMFKQATGMTPSDYREHESASLF